MINIKFSSLIWTLEDAYGYHHMYLVKERYFRQLNFGILKTGAFRDFYFRSQTN
jgi:hypothetical protein